LILTVIIPGLFALPITAQDGNLIHYDQVVTGEITNETPEIRYSFEGSAGDTIIVSMTNIDTEDFYLESHLELLGPDSQSLYTAGDFSWQWANPLRLQIGPVTLPETGSYTITATRPMQQAGDSSGQFELVIKRVEVIPLAVNETVAAEIDSGMPVVLSYAGGSTDIYRLVGDKLEGIGSFTVEVRDPHGVFAPISQGYSAYQDQLVLDALRMSEAGEYLIVVRREEFYNQQGQPEPAADVLRVALTLQPVATQPIALDTAVSGTLSDENPSAYYTFTGSAGDRLRLTGSQRANDPPFWVMVVPPRGLAFSGAETNWGQDSFVLDPLALTMSGEHILLVRRIEATAQGLVPGEGELGPSEYTITLSASQIPILEAGVEFTSVVEGGANEQVYRYDGVAGQTLRVTMRSRGENFWPQMLLDSPAEIDLGRTPLMSVYSTLPTTITFEVTLPVSGVYLFRMYNVYGGSDDLVSGEFGLLVEVVE
jgi:hypothetical protein